MTNEPDEEKKERFKIYLVKLADEVRQADIHYKIFKGLYNSHNNYNDELTYAQVFFLETEYAHIISSLLCMSKVYDKHEDAISIDKLKHYVEGNKNLFKDTLIFDCNDKIVETVNDFNAEIENLRKWRDKVISHLDTNIKYSESDITQEFPIKPTKFEELIRKSMDILNCYSQECIGNKLFADITIKAEDYKLVLEAVRKKIIKN